MSAAADSSITANPRQFVQFRTRAVIAGPGLIHDLIELPWHCAGHTLIIGKADITKLTHPQNFW
jgi:hypothetical protein